MLTTGHLTVPAPLAETAGRAAYERRVSTVSRRDSRHRALPSLRAGAAAMLPVSCGDAFTIVCQHAQVTITQPQRDRSGHFLHVHPETVPTGPSR